MGEKGGAHGMGVGRRCVEREGLLEGKGWVRGTREMVSTYMSCEDREGERKSQHLSWGNRERFCFVPSFAHLFNESFASPCKSVEKQAFGR